MFKGFALFACWALLGSVLSYGLLYAFTPFGLLIVGSCAALASLLGTIGTRGGWPEALGLAAGAGGFCCVVASAASSFAWGAIGAALITGAVAAYVVIARALCVRT